MLVSLLYEGKRVLTALARSAIVRVPSAAHAFVELRAADGAIVAVIRLSRREARALADALVTQLGRRE
jgi:hypothetical protein